MVLKYFLVFFTINLISLQAFAKLVRYELSVTREKINLSSKKTVNFALLINHTIPAPTLEFNEGDDAEIILKNDSDEDEISVHWHGILLDPYMDGVPYVNTPPIPPGKSFTYKFRIRQHGTYWYHSHTQVQEQKGVYGAIIIHPKIKKIKYDRDIVAVLSDWTDENPEEVLKNLKKDGEYYLFKKKTIRSLWGALKAKGLKNFFYNEMTRMGGMDFSDVGYDAFLINGKKSSQVKTKPGEKIRIRIINASASSYFTVSLGQELMKIISADGVDIEPISSKEILIGMAETYDAIYEVPTGKSVELKATSQDATGSASLWLGEGEKISSPTKPKPDLYSKMEMGTAWDNFRDYGSFTRSFSRKIDHHHHHSMDTPLTVNELESKIPTNFNENIPRHDLKLILDGDMERFIWLINGRAIFEDRTISIKKNEVVRITYVNNSMMHHPFHLHGHFFRVLNANGDYSPLKHTVDIPPHGTRTIEFFSNEPGEWMLHCHNLYHLKTGMSRVVKYDSFIPNEEIKNWQNKDPHMMDHFYYRGGLEASTNHSEARFNLMNTWNEFEFRTELRADFGWQGEGDAFYKRWINKYFAFITGGTLIQRYGAVVGGFSYKLPFRFETHTLVDHEGRMRFDLHKKFQWTETLFTDADLTLRQRQPSEFEITLMYQNNWAWAAGLMFTENSLGIGGHYNF